MKREYLLSSNIILSLLVLQTFSFSNSYAGPGSNGAPGMNANGNSEEHKYARRTYPLFQQRDLPFLARPSGIWHKGFPPDLMMGKSHRHALLGISALGTVMGIGAYLSGPKREESIKDTNSPHPDYFITGKEPTKIKKASTHFLNQRNKDKQQKFWGFSRVYAESISQPTPEANPKKPKSPHLSSQEKLAKIQHNITEVERRLRTQKVGEKVTILLGNTGVGKSVIYNYVQGIPLVAKPYNGKMVIDKANKDEEGENGKIVHIATSGTSFPSLSKKGEYFDCPGFDDNRGPKQDIVNAYSLYKLFEQVNNFRLVLVVSKNDLGDKGNTFVEAIGHLGEIFPGRANEIKKCLNLIVAKSTNKDTLDNIKAQILDIRQNRKKLTAFQKEVLDFLADKENKRITFFEEPVAQGDIPVGKELIKGQDYVNIRGITPRISVSDKTKAYIKDLAENIAEETSRFLSSIRGKLDDYTRQIIKSHGGSAQQLRGSFNEINNLLQGVQHTSEAFDVDVENIRKVLSRFDREIPVTFSDLMERRKFLRRIKPEGLSINLDLNKGGRLSELTRDLKPYSENLSRETHGRSVTLRGHIVGTSDLSSTDVTGLTLCGVKGLLVDEDLKLPDVSVAFVSPLWNVHGKRYIDLQGGDGSLIVPSYAQDGENGRPGEPGEPGGSFYGIVDEIHNSTGLTINVSGGNGGKGQDGGKGIPGANGVDGIENDVINRKQDAIVQNEEVKRSSLGKVVRFPLTGNDESRQTFRSGKDGEKGGDAGAGGRRGYGANKGTYCFENANFDETSYKDLTIINRKGHEGQDGTPGIPGRGGRNGKVFKGIYVNNTINGWALTKRVFSEAGAGAGTGAGIAWWGGPFGLAIGAIGGGIVGAAIPIISSFADEQISGGWEEKPHMLEYKEFAPNGERPQNVNADDINEPKGSPGINYEEIRSNWRNWRHAT